MDNLGAIVGPLLAIGLVAAFGTRTAIGLSVIPGIAAAFAIVYAIRHTATTRDRPRTPMRLQIRPVIATAGLRRLFAGITAFELGNAAAALLILRATEQLDPGRSHDSAVTIAIGLYVGYNAAATVTSLLVGRFIDRRSPRLGLSIGAAAFTAAYLGLAFDLTTWIALAPWFVLAGIGIGCAETAEHAAVATDAPETIRGSAFGLLAGIQSFGNVVASATAGILWTTLSPAWAFGFLAIAMTLATALLLRRDLA
jgi:MFS family permease